MSQAIFERGLKRTCRNCDTRFYDLARPHPACPKCGTEFVEIPRPPPAYQSRRKGPFTRGVPNQPDRVDFAADDAPPAEEGPEADKEEEEESDEDPSEAEAVEE